MQPRRNAIINDNDRRRIVEVYEKQEDFLQVAYTLGVKRSTAYSIVRKYQDTRESARRHAGGRKPLLDRESVEFLVLIIQSNPCITLKELNTTLRQVFNRKPHVALMIISRALAGELITLKRNIPAERNSEMVKQARLHYAHWMYQTGMQRHRVYVDETEFDLFTKRAYGRARQGEHVRVVRGKRGNNATVVAAISDHVGVLYYEVH